jgi:hypothetical protein
LALIDLRFAAMTQNTRWCRPRYRKENNWELQPLPVTPAQLRGIVHVCETQPCVPSLKLRNTLTPAPWTCAMSLVASVLSASAVAFSASKAGSTCGIRSRPAPGTATRRPGGREGTQCISLKASPAGCEKGRNVHMAFKPGAEVFKAGLRQAEGQA